MAINKIINESTMSHEKLKERIESIFEFEEVKNGYVDITGPYMFDEINSDDVYRAFIDEKELWNKDKGRMTKSILQIRMFMIIHNTLIKKLDKKYGQDKTETRIQMDLLMGNMMKRI